MYVDAIASVNQSLWLKKILTDLYVVQTCSTKVFIDNQSVIVISNNSIFHGKTKQCNIKLYFLRDVQTKMKFC